MFEISDLKAKKLAELHEIAKVAGIPKYKSLKKNDLVYQILDVQAASPEAVAKEKAQAKNTPEESNKTAPTSTPRKRTRKMSLLIQKQLLQKRKLL